MSPPDRSEDPLPPATWAIAAGITWLVCGLVLLILSPFTAIRKILR